MSVPAAASTVLFSDLSLSEPVLAALRDVGYELPTPIQAATIPHLLAGSDLVGQAQTGTGKTAAFALPLLSKIDVGVRATQAMVLVPTRELALQVSEAFQRYAAHLPGFNVLAIYGGQGYGPQLQSLRRGAHVVVGTPGRVMDHMKRGTLQLDALQYLVLDEADEMLRMGFIEDVEWVLEQAPAERQIALFSATMPPAIRRIAQQHLRSPAQVTIGNKAAASKIRQRCWLVAGVHKLDALTRLLEAEPFDAMLVFTRTKQSTVELAEQLEKRGFVAEALNGDIPQPQRERTIARVKAGQVNIVIATDVAARGLDIERVSHVVNFDAPNDAESYVHRIGRTGRAGRAGEAILFVAPRERYILRGIERLTRQPIEPMQLPTAADVNRQRIARFNQRITAALDTSEQYLGLIEQYQRDHAVPAATIAAALASLLQGKSSMLLPVQADIAETRTGERSQWAESSRNVESPRSVDKPQWVERSRSGEKPHRADKMRSGQKPRRAEKSHAVENEPEKTWTREPPLLAPQVASTTTVVVAIPRKKERPARARRRAARALARANAANNVVSRNAFALASSNKH